MVTGMGVGERDTVAVSPDSHKDRLWLNILEAAFRMFSLHWKLRHQGILPPRALMKVLYPQKTWWHCTMRTVVQ